MKKKVPTSLAALMETCPGPLTNWKIISYSRKETYLSRPRSRVTPSLARQTVSRVSRGRGLATFLPHIEKRFRTIAIHY